MAEFVLSIAIKASCKSFIANADWAGQWHLEADHHHRNLSYRAAAEMLNQEPVIKRYETDPAYFVFWFGYGL